MSVYTENFHLPTLRHIYADSPDIAREANADIKHQLELRRREIDGDIGAFCVHEDLPNVEFGPLAGLPVTIKDQFHLAGTRLGFGFGQLAKNPSKKDAPALAALRKNGAHFIGRTNMPPLALDFQAVDGAGHRTNNPMIWHAQQAGARAAARRLWRRGSALSILGQTYRVLCAYPRIFVA